MGKKAKAADKPKVKLLPVPVTPMQLRIGDRLVTATDKLGYVTGTLDVKRIEIGESCLNVHINDTGCYDRIMTVRLAVPEDEALGIITGIEREAVSLLDIVGARKKLSQMGINSEEAGV